MATSQNSSWLDELLLFRVLSAPLELKRYARLHFGKNLSLSVARKHRLKKFHPMNTHTINILERNNKKVNDGVGSVARRVENTDKRWLLCPVFPTLIRLLCKHTTQKFFSFSYSVFSLVFVSSGVVCLFFRVHEGTIRNGIRVWNRELISRSSVRLSV